ncbi:pep-cterm sorting domain-containing protein [Anaeramoeba flamelloides]|uniref:Pep-cterm sorting domain-containing protein n=1 Tax=Anaeramoeba flamelloides TaxID=1746091 RepID=A0AAV7ZWP6_9EUKA|nr:pep-cterm sorting domain-containing protein [Anaeramoeba flamelloides]
MESLTEHYKSLINNTELADLHFLIGSDNTEFHCHRLILSRNSEYWKKILFDDEWVKNEVEVIDIKIPTLQPRIFEIFLRYYYLQEFAVDLNNVFEVIQATYVIDDEIFKNYCLQWCKSNAQSLLSKKECLNSIDEQCVMAVLDQCQNAIDAIYIYRRVWERAQFLYSSKKKLKNKSSPNLISIGAFKNNNKRNDHLKIITKKENPTKWFKMKKKVKNLFKYLDVSKFSKQDYQEIDDKQLFDFTLFGKTEFQINKLAIQQQEEIKFLEKESLNVLLLVAESNNKIIQDLKASITYSTDIQNKERNNLVKQVKIVHVDKKSPSFQKLRKYQAIFVYLSNKPLHRSKYLGNELAHYVEEGGGLVMCGYRALCESLSENRSAISGRITSGIFLPIIMERLITSGKYTVGSNMGQVVNKHHPIMKNVTKMGGGEHAHRLKSEIIKEQGVELVANWEDGNPLIATRKNGISSGTVVILNCNPIMTEVTGDFRQIISNSIDFVVNNSKK